MSDPMLRAINIQKIYDKGGAKIEVLKGIDLEIYEGEALSIVGASGAGKSTLLHILGTLDSPSLGKVHFQGQDLFALSEEDQARFRGEKVGFVFQFHHLLSEFSALENVMLPARLAGKAEREARSVAMDLIAIVGLQDRIHHFPAELSGGEQQRIAVARALIMSPKLLLADEPTGNLDTHNGRIIQELFFQLQRKLGLTLVVVTHDNNFAARFPRRLVIKDGQWN